MVDLQQLAARAPKLGFGTSRLPDSTLTASILGIVCVNAVTLLVVLCLKYRHLLFTDSYPSKASLSPTVSHVEPLPEKHDATPAPAPAPAALSTELLPELDISSPFPDLERPEATRAQREQMAKDKELYHQLQNLEDHPTATDGARQRLIELLDRTVHEAKADPSGSIISIDRYSPLALQQFFQANHTASSHKYEAYIQRRWAGGPRELFPTYEYAVQWLKLAACVKYVDGSWVSNILNMGIDAVRCKEGDGGDRSRSSTPEREAAKLAWQVITEEFGDGDLAKNHVYLYYELIRSLDPAAQPGDVAGFDGLAPTEGAHRCWTAAIAQQCIGLMAGTDDFFPEALGFNMAYETLAYHLLVTSRELRELKIDDYYFALHITIDNPDSGHAALARVAVEHFLEGVRQRDGPEAMHAMWRRVQAGVILADGLPTTPAAPVEHERSAMDGLWYPKSNPIAALPAQPSSPIEREMMRLLTRKSLAAEKMHCSSRIRIEGLTVEEWLDPATWTDKKALDFLRALGRKRPWVIPGDKASSRLVRELEWGGRMFGAFSARETDLVRQWIGQLGRGNEAEGERGAYERYVGRSPAPARRNEETAVSADTRFIRYASQQLPTIPHEEVEAALGRLRSTKTFKSTPATTLHALRSQAEDLPLSLDSNELAALWFTLPALLEHLPLSPSKLADPLGMCVLRVLRSFSGFPDLHAPETICAGMDHANPASNDDGPHWDGEGNDDEAQSTRGWHEIGQSSFSQDEVEGSLNLLSVAKRLNDGSPVGELCADMLVLRTRPWANADILLGMTYAGVIRLLGTIGVSVRVNEVDARILGRIRAEVQVAIEEYIEVEGNNQVSEAFVSGHERIARSGI